MGWLSIKPERAAAVRELKAAQEKLAKVSSRSKEETPAYYRANKKVNDALENPNLPWWRR